MKPAALLLTLLFAVTSLTVVVWLGRYQGKVVVATNPSDSPPNEVSELPIPESGPFGKATTSETSFNFGTVEVGATGSHIFVITNEGDGPLQVKSGRTSCGQCTFGKVSREDAIPPGETVEVEIKWTIKSYNPNFRQWAEVFTTDPDRKRIELAIEGNVERSLQMEPDSVWALGDMSQTGPTTVSGALYSKIFNEIVIDKAECANPLVNVTWEPASSEELAQHSVKSGLKITVTVAKGAPLGPFRETVRLHCPLKDGVDLEFQLTGYLSGPIEFKGRGWNSATNTVVLGEFPASKGTKIKVPLYVREMDGELVVEKIEQKHNSVKIQVPSTGRPIGKSKLYEVEIEVPPGPPLNRREAGPEEILFKLNHPGASEFKFYVSFHSL